MFEQGRGTGVQEARSEDMGWPDLVSVIPAGSSSTLPAHCGGRY